MGDEEVEDTSLKATVAATLAAVGLSSDADPHHRLGSTRAVAQSQLESMLDALRPLPVSRADQGEAEEAPETVGDLVVRGRLGEGGMGIVELAYQRTLDREVALKRLRTSPAPGSAPQLYGLLDEARVSGRLEHPNIVPVHAIGRDEALGPIVLFKRVQGETWAEALKKDAARLPHDAPTLERHLRVLLQVGHALRYAHSRGVLHRDVKPENVMLGAFGEVYLLDWGLAFPLDGSRPGVAAVAGTATHMAPEMARGDLAALSPATDVFLLGATLHELLTGEPRHRGEGLAATLLAAMVAEPAEYAPAVPPELGAIANRACAADPAHRFEDVEAFQQAIEDYLDQREARLLVESARELVAPIDAEDAIGRSTEHAVRDQAETLRRFQEARFALDQALRLRPSFALARRERRRTLLLMLRWALAREDVGQALAAVEELDEPPPPDLRTLLEALRSAQREKRARMKALERDVDLSVAQPE
ncbi:MAG TPA: serine/threonine-protein kinase, partial [Polyangiaceae bacterium LLY-WYZ-15_(1-7)]|nr:serine/threonine-protein kinase [Polyangiaceae bacterium LLY-WYZ-15_(1-7)]